MRPEFTEQRGFNDCMHNRIIRQRRIHAILNACLQNQNRYILSALFLPPLGQAGNHSHQQHAGHPAKQDFKPHQKSCAIFRKISMPDGACCPVRKVSRYLKHTSRPLLSTCLLSNRHKSRYTPLLYFRHRRARQKPGTGQVMRLGITINVLHQIFRQGNIDAYRLG